MFSSNQIFFFYLFFFLNQHEKWHSSDLRNGSRHLRLFNYLPTLHFPQKETKKKNPLANPAAKNRRTYMMNRRPPLAPPPPPPPAPAPHPTTLPQQDPPPSSQIIPILPTEFARIYSITHPILILSLYYFSFPSIIANPVLALQYLLVPLSFLQLAYVVTCLPTATTTTTSVSGRSGESCSSHFSGGALHSNPPPTTTDTTTTTTDTTTDTTTASKKSSLSSKKKKKGKGKKVQQNEFRLSGKVVVSYYIYI